MWKTGILHIMRTSIIGKPDVYVTFKHIILIRNRCNEDCPKNSHCEWGYCECDQGYLKFKGKCLSMTENLPKSEDKNRTDQSCTTHEQCSNYDINLECQAGKCR